MSTRLLVFDQRFYARALDFAAKHPRYGGDKLKTYYHVSNAARSCGFDEVNAANIDAVFDALEARAMQKESGTA